MDNDLGDVRPRAKGFRELWKLPSAHCHLQLPLGDHPFLPHAAPGGPAASQILLEDAAKDALTLDPDDGAMLREACEISEGYVKPIFAKPRNAPFFLLPRPGGGQREDHPFA
jgi:hypothetical protein